LKQTTRAIIFANGSPSSAPDLPDLQPLPDDLLIAADGGARLCRQLGMLPHILVGDFDSLEPQELADLAAQGVEIRQHPARKDYTDLELALLHAQSLGVREALVVGALGLRWDQTLANLLLPASADLDNLKIRLFDGKQEISLARAGQVLEIAGKPGDTVSLIPLAGDALGVRTDGLEYALHGQALRFGSTRGVSNVLLGERAHVSMELGLLLVTVIHLD
jgi:thiamine pyrophosphokinase